MEIIQEIKDRKVAAIILGVCLLGALLAIWRTASPPQLKLDHSLYNTIGQVVAEETVKAIGNKGRVVAVINANYQAKGAAPYDEWQAFQKELKKHESVSLIAAEIIEPDPAEGSPGCPGPELKRLLEQHIDADAIVFFIVLPNWRWLKQNQWVPEAHPAQIIAVDLVPGSISDYASYFENGFLTLLIGPRVTPLPAGVKSQRPEFDRYFQIDTAQTYHENTNQ